MQFVKGRIDKTLCAYIRGNFWYLLTDEDKGKPPPQKRTRAFSFINDRNSYQSNQKETSSTSPRKKDRFFCLERKGKWLLFLSDVWNEIVMEFETTFRDKRH